MTLRYLRICADSKISTNLHTKTPPPQLLQLFLYLLLTHIQIKPTHGVLGFWGLDVDWDNLRLDVVGLVIHVGVGVFVGGLHIEVLRGRFGCSFFLA